LDNENVDLVGGKNASLGEMIPKLTSEGIGVPEDFTNSDLLWLIPFGNFKKTQVAGFQPQQVFFLT
jgi:hypothetical protein